METAQYRHEYKYPLTCGQVIIEDAKIGMVAEKDSHAAAGGYHIRSLYFDDFDNSCYYDNENGVDRREKYRIRIYDHDRGCIHLEMKQKLRGKTRKEICSITYEQCRSLIHGQIPVRIGQEQDLLRRLAYLMAVKLMRPVVIVDYDRVPYIYRQRDANVRVTFDSNIISISQAESFFDREAVGRGVMPAGQALMEVKYDSFLPNEISNVLQLSELRVSTFSKYYLCRKFMVR